MRFRMFVLAAALAVLGLGLVAAAPSTASAQSALTARSAMTAHTWESCTGNVCLTVDNSYQGSNFVYDFRVWVAPAWGVHTYRILWNGNEWLRIPYGEGEETFSGPWTIPANTCIQGGVMGVPNARSGCWIAP